MVEQSHAGEGHDDVILIALSDDQVVTDGAAGLGDVLDAGGNAALDGVGEGEEGIGAQGHSVTAVQPGPLFLVGQGLGTLREVVLPDTLGADILLVAVDVAVDDVVTAGTAQISPEGQVQGLGVLAQEPGIGFAAGKADAVDSGLLTGTDTDGLAVISKADGVRLGVLQGNERNDQVDLGTLGQVLVGGDDVLKQMLADLEVIAALLKGDAEDLLVS